MNHIFKYIFSIFLILACFFSTTKKNKFKATAYQKDKLVTYFSAIKNKPDKFYEQKIQFFKDSLQDIRKKSILVEFIEISSFSNALSIRCLSVNNLIESYYFETEKKRSKHIDTLYISLNENRSLKDNLQFNKLLSFIEFGYSWNKKNIKNELLKSYLNIKGNFDMFYFENNKIDFSTTFKYGVENTKYTFDNNGEESLKLVNHLLKNYAPQKFVKLWENDFLNFNSIYNKPFTSILKESQASFSKQINYNNNYFTDCI